MKYNGNYDSFMTVQQHEGGYVTANPQLAGRKTSVHQSFESAVNELAQAFGLLEVGERIINSATRQPKESSVNSPLGG